MVKKMIFSLMLALLLLPAAALADVQVIDDANEISASQEAEITKVIDAIEHEHLIDIVVLVTYDVPDDYSDSLWRVEAYADDYYDYNGYGMGDDASGLIYLIDLNNRVQWVSTCGVLVDYIGDSKIDRILDAADPYVRDDEYGSAALAAAEEIGDIMDEGRSRGHFEYDENGQTGKVCGRLPINNKRLWTWAVGAGLIVFALLCQGGEFIW